MMNSRTETHSALGQRRRCFRWIALFVICLSAPLSVAAGRDVIEYPADKFKLLETFEAHLLNQADGLFVKKDWRQAQVKYEAFLKEFSESAASAYAVLQKGRCLQNDMKRNAAILVYTEVLDYFPDEVAFAAPAIFLIGQTYFDDGSKAQALRAWTRMAKDKGYCKHFLAAGALNRLASELDVLREKDEALKYFRQVALDFRTANLTESKLAIDRAVALYVRKLDEPGLRQFYIDAWAFETRTTRVKGDLSANQDYWQRVMDEVQQHGRFGEKENGLRDAYYAYWAKALSGKFAAIDTYQITLAEFYFNYERDPAKWVERLDRQFNEQGKQDDPARILRWIGLYAHRDNSKTTEYFDKLNLNKIPNQVLISLMSLFFNTSGREKQAQFVFRHIRLSEISDGEKVAVAKILWKRDPNAVRDVCMSFKDLLAGKSLLLDYYCDFPIPDNVKRGLPLADELANEKDYASSAYTRKAGLLEAIGKLKEAIDAWLQSNTAPISLYRIANCLERMKNPGGAIDQLREIENFFKDHSSRALMCVAGVYDRQGNQKTHVAVLREIMHKYPGSKESSKAHEKLEALGEMRIGGAQGKEE